MKVAVACYPISKPIDFSAFARRHTRLLTEAAHLGARIAVLPEYVSLELAATFSQEVAADICASFAALQDYREPWLELFSNLAVTLDMHIVAGTFLLQQASGKYRNRCDWFTPQGTHQWQDKLQLTGFEKATGLIESGDELKVFMVDGYYVGVAVCYDCEFPLPVRAQYEAGARLLIVPSCTDTAAGATRVRIGCLARALENRIFVAQAVTAGTAAWSPALDINTGHAAIYAPMDKGFPDNGIIAQSTAQQLWTVAELDISALEAQRPYAQVNNDHDWPNQLRPELQKAIQVTT